MAYMSQEKKKKIKLALDALKLPKAWKLSLSVDNHSSLVITIRSAPATVLDDLVSDTGNGVKLGSAWQINPYHLPMSYTGKTLKVLQRILETVKTAGDWFDKSDAMSDYFHTAFYIDMQFGRWNKDCVFVGK